MSQKETLILVVVIVFCVVLLFAMRKNTTSNCMNGRKEDQHVAVPPPVSESNYRSVQAEPKYNAYFSQKVEKISEAPFVKNDAILPIIDRSLTKEEEWALSFFNGVF